MVALFPCSPRTQTKNGKESTISDGKLGGGLGTRLWGWLCYMVCTTAMTKSASTVANIVVLGELVRLH